MPSMKKKKVPFKSVIPNAKMMGSSANSIALCQGKKDGSLNVRDAQYEMLNLKKGITLESLKKENVSEFLNDLNELAATVKKQCGDDGKACGQPIDILNGIEVFESIPPLKENYDALFKKGSPLMLLASIQSIAFDVIELKKEVEAVSKTLNDLTSGKIAEDKKSRIVSSLLTNLSTIIEITDKISKTSPISPEDLQKLDENTLLPLIDKVLKVGIIRQAFTSKNLNVVTWSKEVSDFEKRLDSLKKSLTKMSPQRLESVGKVLIDANDNSNLPIEEKTLTSGFPNGVKDYIQFKNEALKPEFLTTIVMKGKKTDAIKNLLFSGDEFVTTLEPVMKIRENGNSLNVGEHLTELKTTVQSALGEISSFDNIQTFIKCSQNMKGFDDFNSGKWTSEKQEFEKSKVEIPQFAQNFKISFAIQKTRELEKIHGIDGFYTAFQKFTEIGSVKTEIENMKTQLATLINDSLASWAKSQISVLIQDTSAAIQKMNLKSFSNCQKTVAEAKRAFKKPTPFSKVLDISAENNDIIAISDSSKNYDTLVTDLAKLESTQTPAPVIQKRSVVKVPQLKNATVISHEINKLLVYLRNLDNAYSNLNDLQQLIQMETKIDAFASKVPAGPNKDKIDKLWNPETKKVYKAAPVFVNDTMNQLIDEPTDSQSLANFISTQLIFDGDMDLSELMDALKTSNLPIMNVDKLKGVSLKFTSSQAQIKSGNEAILDFLSYLDQFVKKPTRGSTKRKETGADNDNEKNDETLKIVGASVGGLFLAFLIVGGLCLLIRHIKSDKEKVPVKVVKVNGLESIVAVNKTPTPKEEVKGQKAKKETENEDDDGCKTRPIEIVERNGVLESVVLEPEEPEIQMVPVRKLKKEEQKNLKQGRKDEIDNEKIKKEHEAVPFEKEDTIYWLRDSQYYANLSAKIIENLPLPLNMPKALKIIPCVLEYQFGPKHEKYEVFVSRQRGELKIEETDEAKKAIAACKDISTKVVSQRTKTLEKTQEQSEKLARAGIETKTLDTAEEPDRADAGRNGKRKNKKGVPNIKDNLWKFKMTFLQLENQFNYGPQPGEPENPPDYDFSNVFYKNPTLHENNTVNFANIAESFFSEKLLEIESWPYKDPKTGNVYSYHLPLSTTRKIFEEARRKLGEQPMQLELNRKTICIVGDIHGKMKDFFNHINCHIDDDDMTYVFLGDYVDRGPRSCDVALAVALLININPNKFHFLCGNHETALINQDYGYYDECVRTFGKHGGRVYWEDSNLMFKTFAYSALLNGVVWCAHGGPVKEMVLGREKFLELLKRNPVSAAEADILNNIIWADPTKDVNLTGWPISTERGEGTENFTDQGVTQVCQAFYILLIIRAHQVEEHGYRLFAAQQGLTTFGSTHNKDRNKATHVLLNSNGTVEIIRFNYTGKHVRMTDKSIYRTFRANIRQRKNVEPPEYDLKHFNAY